MNAKNAKQLWDRLVEEKVEVESICEKLKHIQFGKSGKMKPGRYSQYARKHFPNLVSLHEIEVRGGQYELFSRP